MAIDKAVRDSIIVAAITGAGTVGEDAELWEASVLRGARKITAVLSDPESVFAKAVDEIDSASKFVSLLSLVKREEKSKRGVVYFQTLPRIENGVAPVPTFTFEQVSAIHAEQASLRAAGVKSADLPKLPDGLEAIRTDRTDTLDGLLMAKEATSLIGHRVLVYKINEVLKSNPNLKVRVLKHLTDLGSYDSYVVPAKVQSSGVAAAPAVLTAVA